MSDLTTLAAQQAATYFEQLYGAGAGYIAVGNSSTAFSVGDTALAGASQARAVVAASSVGSGVLTLSGDFGTSAGNFEWLEVGVFDAPSGGTLFVRKVLDGIGTKPSSQTWGVELTITVSAVT
jgi:hypothetical protein